MVLPANYKVIIYKFRIPDLISEQEFIDIQSTDKLSYLGKIKNELRKEKKVFKKHHRLSHISLMTGFTLVLISLILILFYSYLVNELKIEILPSKIFLIACLITSFITLLVLQTKGFLRSFLSFKHYIKEKYHYYHSLKEMIDDCSDFISYREKYRNL